MTITMLDISTYQGALRRVVRDRAKRGAIALSTLAWGADMHPSYLSHCLSGKRPLSVEILNRLAGALDTTTAQLHKEARALTDAD